MSERSANRAASGAAVRVALAAPRDDEPVTESDAAIALARADVEAGRVDWHEEILREFTP